MMIVWSFFSVSTIRPGRRFEHPDPATWRVRAHLVEVAFPGSEDSHRVPEYGSVLLK